MGISGFAMALVSSFIYFPFVTVYNGPYEFAKEYQENRIYVDPDLALKPVDLIISRGFKARVHKIYTPDNYILTAYQIVHPFINKTRAPLILMHGFQESCLCFLQGFPTGHVSETFVGGNFAFELAKQGYDVWLPNFRGTRWSMGHKFLNPQSDRQYWKFSLDQLSQFDLKSTVDYVRKHTGHKRVAYVGHSQGTTTMFQLLSAQPKYNDIVKPFVALAPVVYLTKIRMPILAIASRIPLALDLLDLYGGRFLPTDTLSNDIGFRICGPDIIGLSNCTKGKMLKFAGEYNHFRHFNKTRFPILLSSRTIAVSSRQTAHFGQYIKTGKFRMYDYSPKKNERKYGSKEPPYYNLGAVTNEDMMFIIGRNDQFTVLEEYYRLISELGTKPRVNYIIQADYFDHYSFLYGTHVNKYAIIPVLKFLDGYFPWHMKPKVSLDALDIKYNEV